MEKTDPHRIWELDFLRGIAIISMVALHAFDDFLLLKGGQVLDPGLRFAWQRGTAILFLLIFGVAGYLSYSRNNLQLRPGFQRCLQRGASLLGWGLIITLTTAIFLREGFVIFGILHLMGIGSVMMYPLLAHKYPSLILGILFILAGNYLSGRRFTFVWLVWLGMIPEGFSSIDFFPIIPWFGYILIGIFLGGFIVPNKDPKFRWKEYFGTPIVKWVCFLGQRSLLIYLVHQPILLAIIYAV